jgi:hypothetical protein
VAENCLLLRCGPWIVALPTQYTEALTQETPAGTSAGRGEGVVFGGRAYAAWDLGMLLGGGPAAQAWVLVGLPTPRGTLRLALSTGPHLMIAATTLLALPEHATPARPGAIVGGVPLPPSLATSQAEDMAWVLDARRLLTQSEIATSWGSIEVLTP